MSETPIYFFLAQLNSLLTSGLRLGYAFLFLSLLLNLKQIFKPIPIQIQLKQYWLYWTLFCGALSFSSGLTIWYILQSPNIFLQQGLCSSVSLCASGIGLLLIQKIAPKWTKNSHRLILLGFIIATLISTLSLYSYSFSRSDKDIFSILLALPSALALSYFPLCFLRENQAAPIFHRLYLILVLPMFCVYYGWMYPLTKHIPAAGEFYPFINLYDWILPLFVILYLGNVYIDFWLKKRKRLLAMIWNYPVAIVAVLCQWLNTNILETLAL